MLVVGTRPAEATFPGPNGKIAYTADDGEFPGGIDSEIYTIEPSGGMPFNVTDNDSEDGGPDYSPDGKKIAYHSYDGNDFEIYTINATGGRPFHVTDNTLRDEFDPDYSPNGKKLAYSGSSLTNPTGTGYEIYTINVGGDGKTRVTNNDTSDSDPSWGSRP
jgi:TolB protein